MDNRNKYLDIQKGLLMILVIIGHLACFEYESRTITLIYSFHMPAFLIICGILTIVSIENGYFDLINKKIKSILIPYFFLYFLSFIILGGFQFNNYIKSFSLIFTGIGDPNYSINLPLWFLTYYFVASVIFNIIYLALLKSSKFLKIKNNLIFEIVFLLIIVLLSYISFYYCRIIKGPRLYYNIETAILSLPFVYFGHLIRIVYKNYFERINNFYKNNKILLTAIILILLVLIFIVWYKYSLINMRLDLNARNIRQYHLTLINGILGYLLFSVFTFIIYKIKIINDLIAYIGRLSIYILCFHVPLATYIELIIKPLMPNFIISKLNDVNMIYILYNVITQLVFSILLYYIIKGIIKYLNKFTN